MTSCDNLEFRVESEKNGDRQYLDKSLRHTISFNFAQVPNK